MANVPAGFGSTKIFEDVVFDEKHDLTLDIFVPDGLTDPAPVIVFYYGGRTAIRRNTISLPIALLMKVTLLLSLITVNIPM